MNDWLTLITTLPTENATERQRAWRALKASGAAVLRDGVYLLPHRSSCRTTLTAIATDVLAGNGSAWVTQLAEPPDADFTALFDRSSDYATLLADIHPLLTTLTADNANKALKQSRKLRKTFIALGDTDYFPGPARQQAETALCELEARCATALSPDEPHAMDGAITLRRLKDFRRRVWATRQRPWVDRLASAWLIKRFIDPAAKFRWLSKPRDCPANAVGFDFDGATFTHIGDRVTFEVLLRGFDLQDAGLLRVGALVHYLDVGGVQPAEAAGLQSILAGMRSQITDDDKLLTASFTVFDSLYAAFKAAPDKDKS